MIRLPHAALATASICALLSMPAHAEWNGQGELGFVMARGNTDSDTGNLKLTIDWTRNDWKHSSLARVLYGRSNDIDSARRWETAWQSEYKLNDHPFVFAGVRFEQDDFSGFAEQSTASLGLGYHLINSDKVKLSASLGGGYRELLPQQLVRDERGEVIERIRGERTDDIVGSAGVKYEHKLTDTTTLNNNLLVETGADNTLTRNDLSLQVAMTEKLALGVGYSVRHNAEPPEGLKKTDQLTTVNLVYKLQ